MNIAFSCDDIYVPYCGISIISLLENNKDEDITLYIVGHNLSDQSKKSLYRIGNKYNTTIEIIDVDGKLLEDCRVFENGYITVATYIRLFFAQIFPHLNKILYLDCDLIVEQDLHELWNNDITNYSLGGIIDIVGETKRFDGHINAGVLLINLDYWRKNNIQQKFIDYINQNEYIEYLDQDVINEILKGTILHLPMKYNVQTPFYLRKNNYPRRQVEIDKAVSNPAIIHFTFPIKPWNKDSIHTMTSKFRGYMKMSEWKNLSMDWHKYTDKTRRKLRFYKKNILCKLGLKKSIYKDLKQIRFGNNNAK